MELDYIPTKQPESDTLTQAEAIVTETPFVSLYRANTFCDKRFTPISKTPKHEFSRIFTKIVKYL